MGRPPLPVGTFDKIGFVEQANGDVQPRSRFRDLDGRTRLVSKTGRSRAAAERALKAELTHRQTSREDRRSGRPCGSVRLPTRGSRQATTGRPARNVRTGPWSRPNGSQKRAGVLTEGHEGSSMQLPLGIRASGDGES